MKENGWERLSLWRWSSSAKVMRELTSTAGPFSPFPTIFLFLCLSTLRVSSACKSLLFTLWLTTTHTSFSKKKKKACIVDFHENVILGVCLHSFLPHALDRTSAVGASTFCCCFAFPQSPHLCFCKIEADFHFLVALFFFFFVISFLIIVTVMQAFS